VPPALAGPPPEAFRQFEKQHYGIYGLFLLVIIPPSLCKMTRGRISATPETVTILRLAELPS